MRNCDIKKAARYNQAIRDGRDIVSISKKIQRVLKRGYSELFIKRSMFTSAVEEYLSNSCYTVIEEPKEDNVTKVHPIGIFLFQPPKRTKIKE